MTERIDQLVAAKDGLDPVLLDALDDDDRADALGRIVNPDSPDRVAAMGILAHSDPEATLFQALDRVIQEGAEDPSLAVAAVTVAGTLGADAFPLVMDAASSQPLLVALAAWRTLAEIGRSDSLGDLQQIAPPPGDVLGDQALFTLAVIAYRGRVAGFELPAPDDTHIRVIPNGDTLNSITPLDTSDRDFALLTRVPSNELYGIVPVRESTITVDCGEDHMLVSLDSGVQPGIPGTLMEAPALLGVVTVLDSLETSYSARYLILTWPDGEDGFNVALHEPGGAQAYYGHPDGEEIADGEATFGLFALDLPGLAPISLTPTLSASGVTLGGDRVAMTDIITDRLEPEAG